MISFKEFPLHMYISRDGNKTPLVIVPYLTINHIHTSLHSPTPQDLAYPNPPMLNVMEEQSSGIAM